MAEQVSPEVKRTRKPGAIRIFGGATVVLLSFGLTVRSLSDQPTKSPAIQRLDIAYDRYENAQWNQPLIFEPLVKQLEAKNPWDAIDFRDHAHTLPFYTSKEVEDFCLASLSNEVGSRIPTEDRPAAIMACDQIGETRQEVIDASAAIPDGEATVATTNEGSFNPQGAIGGVGMGLGALSIMWGLYARKEDN